MSKSLTIKYQAFEEIYIWVAYNHPEWLMKVNFKLLATKEAREVQEAMKRQNLKRS